VLLLEFESIVVEKMEFSFNLQSSSNVHFNFNSHIVVNSMELLTLNAIPANLISNPCGVLSTSGLNVSASSGISYF
jgi:hypothetical protein